MSMLETDVLIVGAGASGGVAALELATRGIKVVCLEQGDWDLPDDEAAWLRKRARQESRLIERCFGLVTEVRLEGIAVTDPEDYLTDVSFPGQSTVARVALLALPDLLPA